MKLTLGLPPLQETATLDGIKISVQAPMSRWSVTVRVELSDGSPKRFETLLLEGKGTIELGVGGRYLRLRLTAIDTGPLATTASSFQYQIEATLSRGRPRPA